MTARSLESFFILFFCTTSINFDSIRLWNLSGLGTNGLWQMEV